MNKILSLLSFWKKQTPSQHLVPDQTPAQPKVKLISKLKRGDVLWNGKVVSHVENRTRGAIGSKNVRVHLINDQAFEVPHNASVELS